MTRVVTGHKEEPTICVLLNGQGIKLSSNSAEIITCPSAQNKRSAEYSALNRTSISSSESQTSSMEGGRGKHNRVRRWEEAL